MNEIQQRPQRIPEGLRSRQGRLCDTDTIPGRSGPTLPVTPVFSNQTCFSLSRATAPSQSLRHDPKWAVAAALPFRW